MSTKVHHVPTGLTPVTPQLVVKNARAFLDFAKQVFDATGEHTMHGPDGKTILHGFFLIGGAAIFVSDVSGPAQPTSANVFLYVPDVDAVFAKALAAGAKTLVPPATMFWGDRWGMLADPFGNIWQIATHVEDVSEEEMKKRGAAAMANAK